MLALGAAVLPAALLLRGRAGAEEFAQVPLPPEAARQDPLHEFWDGLWREFPAPEDLRYFNVAGLAIQPFEVLQRVQDVALEVASHGESERAKYFDAARATVARLLHAEPDEIALLRNATEAMNIVARGIELRRGDEVILTTHEHPGGAAPWVALSQELGVRLRLYDPTLDSARDATAIWQLATKRTRVVALSHVLCTLGGAMPVREIASEARRRGVWCVIDGAQAAGILPVDVGEIGADCYLSSGHKWILGPVETGFLHVRRDQLTKLRTRFAGAYAADSSGWSLEANRLQFLPVASRYEYGTRNAASVAGLSAAIAWQEAIGLELIRARSLALAARFRAGIAALPGVEVLTPPQAVQVSPIVTFRIPRRPNTQVADWLRRELGMRLRTVGERNLNGVRAAFHLANRRRDVDWLVDAVRVLGS
jgi:selenocysteine lyase/cysteine desulfurase